MPHCGSVFCQRSHILSRGFCRVGRVLEPSYPLQRRKGKDGEIALWHTIFQDKLLHLEALHSTEYRWTLFLLSGPWPHPSSSKFGCGAQGRGQPLAPGVAPSLAALPVPASAHPHPPSLTLDPLTVPDFPNTPLSLTLDPFTVPDFPNTSSDSQSHGTKTR